MPESAAQVISTPAPASVPGTTPPAPAWFDAFEPETKAEMSAKGWDKLDPPSAFQQAYKSYSEIQKQFTSGEKLALPRDMSDQAGWEKVWNRLGRPDTPDKYEIQVPEGQPDTLAKAFAPIFHKAGLTKDQVKSVTTAWNDFNAKARQDVDAAFTSKAETELATLQTEWGQAFDERTAVARKGAGMLGLDQTMLDAMERVVGTKALISKMFEIGQKMGEAPMIGKGAPQFTPTPDQARKSIDEKLADPIFMGRYTNKDPAIRQSAIEEMSNLHKLLTR